MPGRLFRLVDCLHGCDSLVAEHWLHKPSVLGPILFTSKIIISSVMYESNSYIEHVIDYNIYPGTGHNRLSGVVWLSYLLQTSPPLSVMHMRL